MGLLKCDHIKWLIVLTSDYNTAFPVLEIANKQDLSFFVATSCSIKFLVLCD